ncbi:MAG TPA: hypothetical protein V6C84_24680 [Coleofasciculaceae cyanobacterium]|jgi:hypothetical protein
MSSNPVFLTSTLPDVLPQNLPTTKFQIGQYVRWAYVSSHDFGRIAGIVWASEASIQAIGYHYAIQLDPSSHSYANGILTDWAFEEDIELYTPDLQTPDRPPLDLAPQALLHTD